MFKITAEEINQEIIDKYIPQEIKLRQKLIRKINESYQYSFDAHNSAKKEDYSFIDKLLEYHLFHYC